MSRTGEDAREVARGTGLIFVGTFLYQLAEYLYRFALARGLAVENFGTFNQARSVFLIAVVFAALGLGPGVKRFVALKRERGEGREARRAIGDGSILLTFSALAGGVGVFYLAEPLARLFRNPDLVTAVRVLAFAVPVTIGLDYVTRLGEAFRSFRATVVVRNVFDPFFRLIGSVVLLLGGAALPAVLGLYTVSAILGLIIALFLVLPLGRLRSLERGPARAQVAPLLRFSLPLVLGGVLFDFAERIDVLMIGLFREQAAVGLYAAGSSLARALLLFLSATVPVVGTLAAEAVGREDSRALADLHRASTRFSLLFATPIAAGLLLYPGEALSILFGREYAAAATSLRILAPAYLLVVLAGPLGVLLNALGKTHWTLGNMVFRALINIALNSVLIPRFGIAGAAIATLVSLGLAVGLLAGQLESFAPVRRSYSGWGRPLGALALACAASWGVSRAVLASGFGGAALDLVAGAAGGVTLLLSFAAFVRAIPGCLQEGDLLFWEMLRDRFRTRKH